ncbi:MAG: hypothetical protein ABSH51_29750 [Solirubrobacteraceae bacterium]
MSTLIPACTSAGGEMIAAVDHTHAVQGTQAAPTPGSARPRPAAPAGPDRAVITGKLRHIPATTR